MFVDFQRNVTFVHVPKAGGVTVREHFRRHTSSFAEFWGVIDGTDMAHLTISQASRFISREVLESSLKFAMVRNPYDRLDSAFRYFRKYPEYECSFETVDELVVNIETLSPRLVHLRPQCSMLFDRERLTVDRVLRFENFGSEFTSLCRELNLPVDFGCANATGRIAASKMKESSRAIVRRFYKEDFERFQYPL